MVVDLKDIYDTLSEERKLKVDSRASALIEREECARIAENLAKNTQQLLLHCGEMTKQELRTSKAVLNLLAYLIRSRDTNK